MELKWLEDFVAVAESYSFSRAAEVRHVTQSALSRRIKQLEVWLGATLISRATLPMELTPAGEKFLPVAREAIRTFYASREMLQPPAKQGVIRLAALHTLTVVFFPDWLHMLSIKIPDLKTSMIPDRGGIEANLVALADGEADFFLTYAHPSVPFYLDNRRFDFLIVGSDKLVPVSSPELRIKDKVVLASGLLDRAGIDQGTLPYLSYGFSSFFGVALKRLFAAQPAFRRNTIHTNPISVGLKLLAMSGNGLCWLPESLIRNELDNGRLVLATKSDDWFLNLQVRLYRAAENSSPTIDAFWKAAETIAFQEAL
jgi:DNA-binding transcriptional LysR family regulator